MTEDQKQISEKELLAALRKTYGESGMTRLAATLWKELTGKEECKEYFLHGKAT